MKKAMINSTKSCFTSIFDRNSELDNIGAVPVDEGGDEI